MGSSMAPTLQAIAKQGVAGPEQEEREGERQKDDVEHKTLPEYGEYRAEGRSATEALGSPEALDVRQLAHSASPPRRNSVRSRPHSRRPIAESLIPRLGQKERDAEHEKDDAEHARLPNPTPSFFHIIP